MQKIIDKFNSIGVKLIKDNNDLYYFDASNTDPQWKDIFNIFLLELKKNANIS